MRILSVRTGMISFFGSNLRQQGQPDNRDRRLFPSQQNPLWVHHSHRYCRGIMRNHPVPAEGKGTALTRADVTVHAGTGDRVSRLRRWCVEAALPFWSSVGFDPTLRSFHEKTDLAGAPIVRSSRRTMVQCRQVYCFAHTALLGWYPYGEDIAIRAVDGLLDRHWRADGQNGFIFSIDADGFPHDGRRDAYAHAFAAFALAYAYRLRPDPKYKAVADATFAFCDTALAGEGGGLIDCLPRADMIRRQNPHMHLFEACLAWHETTREEWYLARADALFQLFSNHFFRPDTGTLGEYFDDDWQPAEGKAGRLCEPGHHFEWVWLLRRYAAASGVNVAAHADALFDHACRFGIDARQTVVEEIEMDGSPSRTTSRCWQQAEGLKGALAQHESGHAGMPAFAERRIDVLLDRFLGKPFTGGWIDTVAADSTPLAAFVPASTLYHVVLAATEADRVLGKR